MVECFSERYIKYDIIVSLQEVNGIQTSGITQWMINYVTPQS